ncbi:RHO1 GDP-GTP exchange protein 2, partial [Coemansia linderi]
MPMPQQAPHYPRASISAGNLYPQQQFHNQIAPQPLRPVSGLPMPYPSAMVVGGGMPSNNRLVPSQALMNAAATADISRQQREHDFTNALGRRRPTHGSVSSNGSASADHYRPKPPVDSLPELPPFNANTGSDYGGQPGRYRSSIATQPTVDMRVGRSASSASSSSGGYRGGFAPSPFATQRRPLQPTPEQHVVRKQPSTISVASASHGYDPMGSPDLRQGHPGSRSAPDLNLDTMKSSIMEVSHDLDRNPMPQIPTSYAQTHSAHLGPPPVHPLAAASSLSILTDITQSDVSQLYTPPATGLGNAASRHSSSRSSEVPGGSSSRLAPKTPMSSDVLGSAISPNAVVVAPVNTELVTLLENVKPVYPAMLSLVANSFYEIMSQVLQTHTRNGLEYTDCFTGRDAVDAIYAIIKAADRNLAIVVGRALEQQKLFHD